MNLTEKIAEIRAKHKSRKRRPWFRRSIGALKGWFHSRRQHERHHPCAARGTAAKNTHPNRWNIRASKGIRPEARFMKLRAFKQRYNLQ